MSYSTSEPQGPQGVGFRNRGLDLDIGRGSELDGSVMHQTDLKSDWFPTSLANERWSRLTPAQKDHFANEIRWRQTMGSGVDRGAVKMAAEGKQFGIPSVFSEHNVRAVKAFKIQRSTVRAAPNSGGIPMPGNTPGVISVSEISTPIGSAGMDKLPNGQSDPRTSAVAFMSYFGRPPEGVPLDPWIGTPKEYHAFPDYLKTVPPRYITSILMNSVLGYGAWHLSELAPATPMTTNTIAITRWEFNPGMAKRTAFEAPVTVLSHQMNTSKEHMVRYGLGVHAELGFWNTELGRWLFARQLEQLISAWALTIIIGCEFALYHSPKVDDTLEKLLSRPIGESVFYKDLKEEDVRFDAIHKPGGLAGLATTASRLFRQRGIGGTERDIQMVLPESVWQSWRANGFDKNKDDPAPAVKAMHKTVPFRTDKHGETETSRVTFSHGSFYNLDPLDPGFAPFMEPGKFTSDIIAYARWFDSVGGWSWSAYPQLFRRCLWYDYDAENREEDGDDDVKRGRDAAPVVFTAGGKSVEVGAATHSRPATREIGFPLLCLSRVETDKALSEAEAMEWYQQCMVLSLDPTANIQDRPKFVTAREFYSDVLQEKLKPFVEYAINRSKKPDNPAGNLSLAPGKSIATFDALMNLSLATSEFFDICFAHNIPVFPPLLDVSPHQLRQSQTVSFFVAGRGHTYMGYPMCTMVNDGILGTAALSVWAYFRTIIERESVVNFHTAMPCGYERGNDRSVWGYSDMGTYAEFDRTNQESDIGIRQPFKSRFIIGNFPGYKPPDRGTIDISGDFHPFYFKGSRFASGERRQLHYPTAHIYSAFWGWKPKVDKQRIHSIDSLSSPLDNTICSRTTALLPATGLAGSAPRYVEGVDLTRHLCWTGAQDVRDGRPVPIPDKATQEIYLSRVAFAAGGKLV